MLAATNRLKKSSDISRVYRQGKYGGGGVLSVKTRRSGLAESRAVVVVGKKVDKRAVVRNRNRRRAAAALARLWPGLAAGYDIVVSIHSDIAGMPASQLEAALLQALQSSGIKEQA